MSPGQPDQRVTSAPGRSGRFVTDAERSSGHAVDEEKRRSPVTPHPRSLDAYGDILSLADLMVLLDLSDSKINDRLRHARSFGDYTHIPPPRLGRPTRRSEWTKETIRDWLRVSEADGLGRGCS